MTSTGFSWSDFYLICFAVGFCFSFFSFVLGGSRFGRLHLPHFHGHSVAHMPAAHGPVAHAPAAGGHGSQRTGIRQEAPDAPRSTQRFAFQLRQSSRLSWRGLAAPAICSLDSRPSGLAWDCWRRWAADSSAEESFFCSSARS